MDIRVDEDLWASIMFPEGVLVSWLVSDGAIVSIGDQIVDVRIEGARHKVMAKADGRVTIGVHQDALIEPGSVLGQILPIQAKEEAL